MGRQRKRKGKAREVNEEEVEGGENGKGRKRVVREKGVGEEEKGGWKREEKGGGGCRKRKGKAREEKEEEGGRRRVQLRWMCYADEMQESVRSRRWVAALFWR